MISDEIYYYKIICDQMDLGNCMLGFGSKYVSALEYILTRLLGLW